MRIKNFFNKLFPNGKEVVFNNAQHLCDSPSIDIKPEGSWENLHGYKCGSDYYVCIDFRWLGIRTQDVMLKCKSIESYDKWIKYAAEEPMLMPSTINDLPNSTNGKKLKTKFTFNTTDGKSKSYNMTGGWDFYAEVE